jgi:hypothetical protein
MQQHNTCIQIHEYSTHVELYEYSYITVRCCCCLTSGIIEAMLLSTERPLAASRPFNSLVPILPSPSAAAAAAVHPQLVQPYAYTLTAAIGTAVHLASSLHFLGQKHFYA